MSTILNIDTAIDIATVSIARDGELMAGRSNARQKDHGAFLQPAVYSLLKDTGMAIQKLDAIAVSAGPGSYTGLRVGMATAKGLCYALKKPLITINTLEIMAGGAIASIKKESLEARTLFCPMIDARRNEVFTALYEASLHAVMNPCAFILNENSFAKNLLNSQIFFFGNGAEKWKHFCSNRNANFIGEIDNQLSMCKLSFMEYELAHFADLAYSDAFYLKEFFTGLP